MANPKSQQMGMSHSSSFDKGAATGVVKFSIFLLVGLAFTAVLVLYSNAVSNGFEKPRRWYSGADSERTIEKTFEVNPGGELVLETDVGDVQVEGWDKNEVNVIVAKRGSESRDRHFDITFDATKDRVAIRGRYEHKWRFWNWGNFDVRYKIKVPNKFRVNLHTVGGDIVVNNIEGELKGETSGGDVRIESVVGAVNVETSGGDIMIDSVDGKVRAETSGGDIEVKLSGENKGINVSTSGGDITLYLPDGVNGDLDASTSGGGVKMHLGGQFSGKIEDDEVHGKINGGGFLIKAETSGGDIRIYSSSSKPF